MQTAIEYFAGARGEIIYPDELATAVNPPPIRRAYLIDGSWTWAKCWQWWAPDGRWHYARVGTGAYGESVEWCRDDDPV